jgi:phenylpropionate dioxygenase-like ring-hydroxylating dioxygenase large terminal subunit
MFFSYIILGLFFLQPVHTKIIQSYLHKSIPSFFRHWQCVGFVDNIDSSKPYPIQIGELPLVLWKSTTNPLIRSGWTARINICNHMGSTLHTGKITEKGCLKCPYHGLEFDPSKMKDVFGEVQEIDGKLFWAYLPLEKNPPLVPKASPEDKPSASQKEKFTTSFLEIDMDASLQDSALNTMDLRHPEFVHSLGFGNTVPPENIRHYFYPAFEPANLQEERSKENRARKESNRIGLSFDYISSDIMKSLHNDMKITKNFHMFQYPSFSWSRVSFQEKDLFIGVHLLPLGPNKTRWYITIRHNYYTSELGKHFIRMLAMTILNQDHQQMKNQPSETELKRRMILEHVFPEEALIVFMKQNWFSKYRYPDMKEVMQLYSSHSFLQGTI